MPANEVARSARALWALMVANVRYWPLVAPEVRRQLHRWERHAQAIPDPMLRAHARAKLRDERFNAEVAATLATLVDREHRDRVIAAIVAYQVMYDYLDALGEQPVEDPLSNGRQLFKAFQAALSPASGIDYYRHHPHRDDGGYLDRLATTCCSAFEALPSSRAVACAARNTAALCAEAQTLTHAIPAVGTEPLRAWAGAQSISRGLTWWEFAAGAAASSLTVHALLAAAASKVATPEAVERLTSTYLLLCAISTLLDSLIDHEHDIATGSHAYLAYYVQNVAAGHRIAMLARRASAELRQLPNAAHHEMTVAGVAGYYLSSPPAKTPFAAPIRAPVAQELRPALQPILAIFALWRLAKRAATAGAWYPHLVPAPRPKTRREPAETRTARRAGRSGEADDGTRTHDLLHGKQTL
jgi:tetraprenyl-beta-curcumene synthase